MTLKSIHITNYYHTDSGGISTAYNKLLEAALRHERQVRLIVPGESNSTEIVNEFAKIYFVKASYSPVFDRRYRLMLPWNSYIFDQAPIKRILREEKPDIIEIGEKYTLSLMAGLLRKHVIKCAETRPMLVHFSCERMDDNVSSFIGSGAVISWFTRRYVANYVLPMFDFHLANSDYTAQEFRDAVSSARDPHRSGKFFNYCWRVFRAPQIALKDRIFVNQCGVDNLGFSSARKNSQTRRMLELKYDLPSGSKLLLYAGRISPEKNVDLLADMMRVLDRDSTSDFHLLVAGSGPLDKEFAATAERAAPKKIRILGHIGNKELLADLFANCDAFVHPNPREPFGITPLEAMASGLPVVAPNSGGVLSYANDENAWIAEPAADEFAAAVRSICSDESLRTARIAVGLATSNNYTWESSTDSLFALYDQMYSDFTANRELFDYRLPPRSVDFSHSLTAC